jgi:murein DD-endopeptidase MepM/ murein hydrolase activator NlpD
MKPLCDRGARALVRPAGRQALKQRSITLMIVPDAHAHVKRVQVRRELVYGGMLAVLVVMALLTALVVHYSYVVGQVLEARILRQENSALKGRIGDLSGRIEILDGRLAELQRFDTKLREMTRLNDDDRGLAMGPVRTQYGAVGGPAVDADPFAVAILGDDPATRQLHDALLDSRLEGLAYEANRQITSLSEIADYFSAQSDLLASTPSVWPTPGWVTSAFGVREDPYTAERVMHLGVDVSAREGTQVLAPARGVVVYAGPRGAYGNMIAIDHDNGIVTHYAHLSLVLVKVGETVERGQHVGNVGNTGRSTGPHLHYEVRVGGVPVNPRKFILE